MKNVYDIKKEKGYNYILPLDYSVYGKREYDKVRAVLVILHLYYKETVVQYLEYVDKIPDFIHIIITVSDAKAKQELERNIDRDNIEILLKSNRGRDISSFLVACRERILKYQYVCFVHDKKARDKKNEEDISSWVYSIWHNLLGSRKYIENILTTFELNRELGLLVPPYYLAMNYMITYSNSWSNNLDATQQLARRLGLSCDIDGKKPVITLGTCFWAKVDALRKILEYPWCYEDFQDEPLPEDGTISHAIERILSYLAQDAGYDTGWVMTYEHAACRIEYMQQFYDEAFSKLDEVAGIHSYSKLLNYDNISRELLEFCEKCNRIYIYGAGIKGKRCWRHLRNLGVTDTSFIVSDGYLEREKICKETVLELSECVLTDRTGIIVAVQESMQQEIINNIRERNHEFSRIYFYESD